MKKAYDFIYIFTANGDKCNVTKINGIGCSYLQEKIWEKNIYMMSIEAHVKIMIPQSKFLYSTKKCIYMYGDEEHE